MSRTSGRGCSSRSARRRSGSAGRCPGVRRRPAIPGVRDLPAVQVIRAYRGLRDTLFGPGVPFGVYADVATPGRVGVGDSLQLP